MQTKDAVSTDNQIKDTDEQIMINQSYFNFVDAGNSDLSFKLFSFEDNHRLRDFQWPNCYSIILLLEGSGTLFCDYSKYEIRDGSSMMFFSPYQAFKIIGTGPVKGYILNFHPDFLCVYKHHKEIACNGVLFDNIYASPLLYLEESELEQFCGIIGQMITELQSNELARDELLVSYLKIFLINATRMKANGPSPAEETNRKPGVPFILQQLKKAIDLHYRTQHTAGYYAALLNISPKALARITKRHLNKTPTDLITERIIVEAKRDLYLTDKSVKEIAFTLGYNDEFYFSRFFKVNTNVSPQIYRETVGFGKGVIRQI